MIGKWKHIWWPTTAILLVAIVLLAVAGCGGGPTLPSATAANPGFSEAELAEMKRLAPRRSDYQKLLKIKAMERQGTASVSYPNDKSKSRKRK